MKIYTKKGDLGQTSLGSGEKVLKSDLRVEAYGTVDELNSHLGLLRVEAAKYKSVDEILFRIQNELFNVGTHLAVKSPRLDIPDTSLQSLENEIDRMTEKLPPLKNFILPGGSRAAAVAHLARTVCRRAERSVVSLSQSDSIDLKCITYLNRLSDYFFVLARYLNLKDSSPEVIWKP